MSALLILAVALVQGPEPQVWVGDLHLTIKGEGRLAGPAPNWATWKIDREVRGKVQLLTSFKGSAIAGTADGRNLARYETWLGESKTPCQVKIDDKVTIYGPLFAANQHRLDNYRFKTPPKGDTSEWMAGMITASVLQFDYQSGTVTYEAPRIYAKSDRSFRREFVKGPKAWTDKKPIVRDTTEIEFEMVHDLTQPSNWYQLTVPVKPGATEIVLTRVLNFKPNLGASVKPVNLNGKITLVLKRQAKGA